MGLSNLTSSIRASGNVSITGLENLVTHTVIASNLITDLNYQVSSDGILSIFDTDRSKQLSISRNILSFSLHHKNISAKRWLNYNGAIGSNVSGFRIIRNATIVGATIQVQKTGTGTFEIIERTDTGRTDLTTVSLNSESSKIKDNLNIDVAKDSTIEIKLISGDFSYPTVSIELAWKFNFT